MSKKPRIAIIGIGNLGWNLAQRLHACDYPIRQIIASKGPRNVKLAKKLDAQLSQEVGQLKGKIDLVFLCIPDDHLLEIARQVDREGLTIVHCSGHTPVLALKQSKSGVFYPFQTFTKYFHVQWEGIPVFIESQDEEVRLMLRKIAVDISQNVHEVSYEQRKAIHISGVFGANFVNHLLYQCKQILEKDNVGFEVMRPLLEETLNKAFHLSPAGAQTGPARRKDLRVIEAHLQALKSNDSALNLYAILTESIQKEYP